MSAVISATSIGRAIGDSVELVLFDDGALGLFAVEEWLETIGASLDLTIAWFPLFCVPGGVCCAALLQPAKVNAAKVKIKYFFIFLSLFL